MLCNKEALCHPSVCCEWSMHFNFQWEFLFSLASSHFSSSFQAYCSYSEYLCLKSYPSVVFVKCLMPFFFFSCYRQATLQLNGKVSCEPSSHCNLFQRKWMWKNKPRKRLYRSDCVIFSYYLAFASFVTEILYRFHFFSPYCCSLVMLDFIFGWVKSIINGHSYLSFMTG